MAITLTWDTLDPALTWNTIASEVTWDTWGVEDGPPEPLPEPVITVPAPAQWTFLALDLGTGDRVELTHARSRRLTARLRGPDEISFTLDARGHQAAQVGELDTDLLVYRNGQLLARGRIGPSQDQAGANRHTATFTALDYAAVLERRLIWPDETNALDAQNNSVLRYTQIDQEAIGWDLINGTQLRTGGDLAITRGAGQTTGRLRDRDYPVGKSRGEALQQLSEVSDGFDWAITPELVYTVWYPQRGTNDGELLDYGGTVAGFSRSFNPGDYHDATIVTGDDNASPETREKLSYGSAGRWERHASLADVSRQTTLAEHADRLHADGTAYRFHWTLTLTPGRWHGPEQLWVGDTAVLAVRSGRLDVVAEVRVAEIAFAINEDGRERVQVSVEQGQPSLAGHLGSLDRRLAALERAAARS